jgi:hypothetical protein
MFGKGQIPLPAPTGTYVAVSFVFSARRTLPGATSCGWRRLVFIRPIRAKAARGREHGHYGQSGFAPEPR